MITLDSSGLFALLNRRDPDHERTKRALLEAGTPYLVPAGMLAEVAYLLEQRIPTALDPFLADLQSGAFNLDCGEADLPRIRELVARYQDLRLGFADAAVDRLRGTQRRPGPHPRRARLRRRRSRTHHPGAAGLKFIRPHEPHMRSLVGILGPAPKPPGEPLATDDTVGRAIAEEWRDYLTSEHLESQARDAKPRRPRRIR